jgi:hypothetical protein
VHNGPPTGSHKVCSSSIYGFWLTLCYLQILLGSSCQFYVQFLDFLVISAYFCDSLLVDHCAHSNNTKAEWKTTKRQKQPSTKHTHIAKDRVTRNPLKIGREHRCSGRVICSCSTSGTRLVTLVTNPLIKHSTNTEMLDHWCLKLNRTMNIYKHITV